MKFTFSGGRDPFDDPFFKSHTSGFSYYFSSSGGMGGSRTTFNTAPK